MVDEVHMPMMNTTNPNQDLDRLIEEGRKRGYIRRAELEAVLRKAPTVSATSAPAKPYTSRNDHDHGAESSAPEIAELSDLDAAVEQLLAADVDIVDDEEDEARAQEDEEIESGIHAMETDSAPLVDLPDE